MPLTFNELQSSVLTGVRESPVIDISGIRRVRSSILNYDADLPTGTTCLVETNVSFDGEDLGRLEDSHKWKRNTRYNARHLPKENTNKGYVNHR